MFNNVDLEVWKQNTGWQPHLKLTTLTQDTDEKDMTSIIDASIPEDQK